MDTPEKKSQKFGSMKENLPKWLKEREFAAKALSEDSKMSHAEAVANQERLKKQSRST
jgi:hypothetical protein